MTYSEALTAMGLTQTLAESIICIGAISLAVGMVLLMFWQYIAVGAGVFVLFSVYAHHQSAESTSDLQNTNNVEIVQKINPPNGYIEECEDLTDRKDLCQEIWTDRIADGGSKLIEEAFMERDEFKPANKVTLIDTDNQEYKARRTEALRSANAVVLQRTLR